MDSDRGIKITERDLYDHIRECFVIRFYSGGLHEWNGLMDFARHVAIGAGSKDKGWNYPDQRKERLKEGIEQSIKLEHGRLAKISTKANDDVFDYYMKKVTIWDFIKMKFGWKKMIEPHFEMVVHCHGLKDIDK